MGTRGSRPDRGAGGHRRTGSTWTYTLRDLGGNDVDTTDNAVPGLAFDDDQPRPVRYTDHGDDHGPDLHRHRRRRQHRPRIP